MTENPTLAEAAEKSARRAQPVPVARSETVGDVMSDQQQSCAVFSENREQALIGALAAELGPSWDVQASASLNGYFAALCSKYTNLNETH